MAMTIEIEASSRKDETVRAGDHETLPTYQDPRENDTDSGLVNTGDRKTPGPLSIIIDKQLIYPPTPPANALYHLSRTLDSVGFEIELEESIPESIRADGSKHKLRNRKLYSIIRHSSNSYRIRGHRRNGDKGEGMLSYTRHTFSGDRWSLCFKEEGTVLTGRNGEWMDSSGTVVAEEQNEVQIKKRGKKDDASPPMPTLIIAEGVEDLKGLLVAVWCAKTWYAEMYSARHRSLTRAEGTRITIYAYGRYWLILNSGPPSQHWTKYCGQRHIVRCFPNLRGNLAEGLSSFSTCVTWARRQQAGGTSNPT